MVRTKRLTTEFFKKHAIDALGSYEAAKEYRQLVYMGSASAAEVLSLIHI